MGHVLPCVLTLKLSQNVWNCFINVKFIKIGEHGYSPSVTVTKISEIFGPMGRKKTMARTHGRGKQAPCGCQGGKGKK